MSAGHRRIRRGGGDRLVRSVCRWVEVSGSGCCARRNRPRSSTARRGEDPAVIVVGFFDGSERAHRLPPGPRGAGPRRRRGLSLGVVRDRGGGGSGCPSASSGTGRDGSCRRRIFRAGPAGWPGRRRHRARDETGGRHRAWSGPAGIRPPGGRRGLFPGGGVVGGAIAGRMRVGLVAGASVVAVPGPSADPWCRGPSLGSGGLDARRPDARGSWPAAGFSRPSGGPVAAVAVPPPSRSPRSRGRNS